MIKEFFTKARKDNKVVSLLWSGGYDSTYLLLQYCEELSNCKEFSNDLRNNLVVYTVENNFCGQKSSREREKEAREKIKAYIKEKYPTVNISYETVKLDFSFNDKYISRQNLPNTNMGGLAQPITWLSSVFPLMYDHSILITGYIREDDAIVYDTEIKDLFKAMNRLYGKNMEFEMPLMWYNKSYIITHMIAEHYKVFKMCVSCEGVASCCNTCVPCTRLTNTMYTIIGLYETGLHLTDGYKYIHSSFEKKHLKKIRKFIKKKHPEVINNQIKFIKDEKFDEPVKELELVEYEDDKAVDFTISNSEKSITFNTNSSGLTINDYDKLLIKDDVIPGDSNSIYSNERIIRLDDKTDTFNNEKLVFEDDSYPESNIRDSTLSIIENLIKNHMSCLSLDILSHIDKNNSVMIKHKTDNEKLSK